MSACAPRSEARWSLRVPAILLVTGLIARLPFLFPSVIDWDESTFILIGQSWADGNLPFTEHWDLKGPLLFAPFALAIELFGRSIVAIRLIGVLFVVLTGYVIYHLYLRLFGPHGALAGAAFTILAITITPGGQAVMSETIAILPLTLAALALSEGARRPAAGFLAGACVSIASLVRPNLGLCAIALGVFGVLMARGGAMRSRTAWALGYIAGGATPALVLAAVYAREGSLGLLVESIFGPSLAYATTNLSAGDVSGALVEGVAERLIKLSNIAYLLVATALVLAYGRLAQCWRRLDGRQRELVLLTMMLALSIMVSILIGGQAWLHYLIQVLPFTCPLIGLLIAPTLAPPVLAGRTARIATFALLLAASLPVIRGYGELVGKLQAHGTPFADTGYTTAAFLESRLDPDDRILFLTHHIAGWLLGRPPIDRIVHPSNFARDEHVPVPGKLESILATRPEFVVISDRRKALNDPRVQAALAPVLEQRYREVSRFEDVIIFEARDGTTGNNGSALPRFLNGVRSPAP